MSSPSAPDWIQGFQASRAGGREGQVYLIEGDPRGAALDTAVGFLQAVLCEDSASGPCLSCRNCRSVAGRSHTDVQWIEPEGASRQIPIDVVREQALARIQKTSYAGGWKGVVFLHADRLSLAAANALLKALEEPPPRTLLLLLTDAVDRLPRTVLSRCRRLRVPGTGSSLPPDVQARLLDLLAEAGNTASPMGRIGVAAEVAGLLATCSTEIERRTGEEAAGEDEKVRTARIRTRMREATGDLLRIMERWQRDLLVCALGQPGELLENPSHAEAIRRQASGMKPAEAMRRVAAVEQARRRLELNLSAESVLDGCLQQLGPPR